LADRMRISIGVILYPQLLIWHLSLRLGALDVVHV